MPKSRKSLDSAAAAARRAQYAAKKARADAETAAWRKIEASYKGGVPTRTSESYPRSDGYRFGTAMDRHQLISARDRAYQAFDNNPIAKTLAETETDNVIGDGLNYKPTTDTPWDREAEDRYYLWLEACSVRGGDMETGCELQRSLWEQSRVPGDIGWVLVSRGSDSYIQVIPSENIVTPNDMHGDPAVYDGIRFDPEGRPTTYYVMSNADRGARKFFPIQARDFVFLPHFTKRNQARGVTCYNTIFELLAHLDRYVDGVSLAAWMATVFGIIFKQQSGAKELSVLPTIPDSQGIQRAAITLEEGMVKYIGKDDEVAQVQAQQPMQQTSEFIRAMFRMLGQPFGMPLEVLAMDMSTCNFASARIGLLPFYRKCRIKAGRFASRWSRTIRWWLSRERQRADDDPKKWKTAFPENYWNHDLRVNAWAYTDPVSEVQGKMLEMDAGLVSPQMVIAELGRDAEQIIRERLEWQEKTKELPQLYSTMSREASPEPTEAGADPNAPDPELERIKGEADAYGVGVRAGVITPQTDDENAFRQKLGLPTMGADAKKAWKKDKGVRRPITLTAPDGARVAPGVAPAAPEEGNGEDNGDSNGNEATAGRITE